MAKCRMSYWHQINIRLNYLWSLLIFWYHEQYSLQIWSTSSKSFPTPIFPSIKLFSLASFYIWKGNFVYKISMYCATINASPYISVWLLFIRICYYLSIFHLNFWPFKLVLLCYSMTFSRFLLSQPHDRCTENIL